MAARQVLNSATLEQFRTTFNTLSSSDFGDIGTLHGSLAATSVIGAVNEIYGIVLSTAGFTITDGSTSQGIGSGETLTVTGTANQITAAVSVTDTLTLSLPSVLVIPGTLAFEGSTADSFETTLTATDPTADRTITLPNSTGTLVVAGDVSGDVTMSNAGVVSLASGSVDLAHMSSESVDEDNLHISNTGSNGDFLTKQSGNTGGLTWAQITGSTSSIFTTAVTLIIYNSAGVAQKTIVGSST
jgi:hypothetical protein